MPLFRFVGFPLFILLWITPVQEVLAQLSKNATLVDILFECDNVDAMCLDCKVLYCVHYDYLYSYDVSNPGTPVPLDTLDWGRLAYPPPNTEWCDYITVRNGYLYMCSYYQGVIIVDVHNSRNMIRLNEVDVPNADRLYGIRVHGNWLLVNDWQQVFVFDITQPDAPVFVSKYFHYYQILSATGKSLPSMAFYESRAFCVFDPPGLLALGELQLDGSYKFIHTYNTSNVSAVGIDDEHIFFTYRSVIPGDEYDYLAIYHRGDNDSLTFLSRIQIDIIASSIVRYGNYIYLFFAAACGFEIVDINNPNDPKIAAFYYNAEGSGGCQLEVLSDYIYYTTPSNGLIIVKVDLLTESAKPPIPSSLSLSAAYPNPVTSVATIEYAIPARQYVTLELYNALGQKVSTLCTGVQEPGNHTTRLDAAGLPAGMYLCVLRSGDGAVTQAVAVRR